MATVTHAPDLPSVATPTSRAASGAVTAAGLASLGAGTIHAAAVGVHSEHRGAVWAFVAVAAMQLGLGAFALARRSAVLAVAVAAANAAAFGGWVLAKTNGIAFVEGLDVAEPIQWADAAAAALAMGAVLFAAGSLLVGRRTTGSRSGVTTPTSGSGGRARWALNGVGAVVAVVTLTSMVATGSHHHTGQTSEGHDAGAHDRAVAEPATRDHGTTPDGDHSGHGPAAAVAPQEYDPAMPIDLSGVPGVTPEQQARAENLIAITLIRLPQWADYRTAEAAGYHSIGDGVTGHEHFVNWKMIDDDQTLNPDQPESLVYDTTGGGRRLVSAMYMLPQGETLDTVPDIGGKLTQWHIHDNLCFTKDETAPRVAGITSSGGGCPSGLQKFTPVPMIHVWIEKHPCGPFAALEGVGAGQVKPDETQACDQAHGASGS